ncbi:MAG TPA: thiamine phosphate synthase [Bacteroidia bacterium]|nr:thiamine phosphate synthase [Bacteroidia bacterium]
MKKHFHIILLTPEGYHDKEIHILNELFLAGLDTLHVRKPGFSKQKLRDYLAGIPRRFHKKTVIHSHYSLLKEFDLKGIHLTEKTRRKKLPVFFNRKKHALSASFHSIHDVKSSRRKYDHIFLSPVFNSISKKNYKSIFDREELTGFLRNKNNITALGGISDKNIKLVKQMGFAGAAVLGFIWENKSPRQAYKKLASKIK